jgi:hypothetical protein
LQFAVERRGCLLGAYAAAEATEGDEDNSEVSGHERVRKGPCDMPSQDAGSKLAIRFTPKVN